MLPFSANLYLKQMTNFFLTDKNGTKHSFTEQQLRTLAAKGKITPTTPLETDSGHKGLAGQIPGLQFNTAAPTPFVQTAPQRTERSHPQGDSGDEYKKHFNPIPLFIGVGVLFLVLVIGGMFYTHVTRYNEREAQRAIDALEESTRKNAEEWKRQELEKTRREVDRLLR